MSTQTRQYKQLTLDQRYQIPVRLEDLMQKEIADMVGISERALSRELSRNTGDQGCRPETAHALATNRQTTTVRGHAVCLGKLGVSGPDETGCPKPGLASNRANQEDVPSRKFAGCQARLSLRVNGAHFSRCTLAISCGSQAP